MKKYGSGFTIVELLIVVVVIAILAAITIVSYNGISQRAKNTEVLSRIDSYTKIFQLYKVQNGAFPGIVSTEAGNTVTACLGDPSEYSLSSPFSAGNCGQQNSTVYNASATLVSQLKTISPNLPAGTIPAIVVNGNNYRGLMYSYIDSTNANITYVLSGNNDCARGTKIYESSLNLTICVVALS